MLDTNNNGFIDYTEFLAGCMKSKIYLNEKHLRIAFSYFDKVNNFVTQILLPIFQPSYKIVHSLLSHRMAVVTLQRMN